MSSSRSNNKNYEEGFRRVSKLLNSLMSRADAGPFLEPVDWRGLELYDYPKIISKMMDLGTIKRKLERSQYKTPHEVAEDIRLVWKNCWTYNMEGSDFWLLAKSFSKRFEDRYKKIRAECNMGEEQQIEAASETAAVASSKKSVPDQSNKQSSSRSATPVLPSVDNKVRLASNLYLLNGKELGYVMTQIELKCPEALQQQNQDPFLEAKADTTLEINMDALDARTLTELDQYVREKVGNRHAASSGSRMDNPIHNTRPNKKRKK